MRPVLEYDDDVISGFDGYEFSHCPGVARSGQGLDGEGLVSTTKGSV